MPLLYPDRPTKYPVVNPDPTMSDALSNFNFSDIRNLALLTFGGAAFGWFGGEFIVLILVTIAILMLPIPGWI